jgi:hypothetical protein
MDKLTVIKSFTAYDQLRQLNGQVPRYYSLPCLENMDGNLVVWVFIHQNIAWGTIDSDITL